MSPAGALVGCARGRVKMYLIAAKIAIVGFLFYVSGASIDVQQLKTNNYNCCREQTTWDLPAFHLDYSIYFAGTIHPKEGKPPSIYLLASRSHLSFHTKTPIHLFITILHHPHEPPSHSTHRQRWPARLLQH